MEFISTGFNGLFEIIPKKYGDGRGYFFESFHRDRFKENGINFEVAQVNQSLSSAGVVRGLHLQLPPFAQAKLVRVISGEVLDIVVDVRPSSETYGKHFSCLLNSEKNNILYVPKGFAHGFISRKETVFQYLVDEVYNREYERGIQWNDPELGIDWQISSPVVSEKDQGLPTFEEFKRINTFT